MSLNIGNEPWKQEAACKGMDISLFFPRRGEVLKIREAKKICLKCPVIEECREYSFHIAGEFDTVGIFGGLTADNRKQMLKEMGVKVSHRQAYVHYRDS